MALLALGLVAKGLRVGLITYPIHRPRSIKQPLPELTERASYAGDRRLVGKLAEMVNVWRALSRADARTYIFRGGAPVIARRGPVHSPASSEAHLLGSKRSRLRFPSPRSGVVESISSPEFGSRRSTWSSCSDESSSSLARRIGVEPFALVPSFAEPVEAEHDGGDAMLWVGRVVEYKRPLAFLELAESLPELRFRMLYIAVDPSLTERVEDIGAGIGNLELFQGLPRPRVLEELDRTKALVSTSSKEGMPNVFLEAWARGIPVISLDYDPDGRIVADRLGVVAGGSMDRLRARTETLWRDAGLRDELGRNGRAYVRRIHSPEAVAGQWAELIRGLGAGDSRPTSAVVLELLIVPLGHQVASVWKQARTVQRGALQAPPRKVRTPDGETHARRSPH